MCIVCNIKLFNAMCRRGVVELLRASEKKSGVQNCIQTSLVFVRKGIWNLKCECVVVDIHSISTSEPAKHGKMT